MNSIALDTFWQLRLAYQVETVCRPEWERESEPLAGEWGQPAQLVRVARFYLVWAKKKGQLNPGFPVGLVSFLVWPAMAETAFLLLDLARPENSGATFVQHFHFPESERHNSLFNSLINRKVYLIVAMNNQ